jgi:hypothetical protein
MIATSWLAPDSWRQNQEDAIREAIGAGPDWSEYLRLVDRHRTPALSWAAHSRVPGIVIEVPESAKRELQRNSDACRLQAVQHCLLLAEVLKGLSRAGIPVMPFKGQILTHDLYGDVGFARLETWTLWWLWRTLLQRKPAWKTWVGAWIQTGFA